MAQPIFSPNSELVPRDGSHETTSFVVDMAQRHSIKKPKMTLEGSKQPSNFSPSGWPLIAHRS